MRLLLVFLLITVYITYAKRSKTLKGVKKQDSSLVDELVGLAGAIDDSKRYRVVPFGHIFRDGFNPKINDPVDLLELESVYVKDSDQIQKLIKSGAKDILPIVKEKPRGFASPKDEFYFGEKEKEEDLKDKDLKDKNLKDKDLKDKDVRHWHDFVGYQRKNINISPDINKMPNLKDLAVSRQKYDKKKSSPSSPNIDKEPKHNHFDRTSFNLAGDVKRRKDKTVNWTTCEEFRRKADFHPKDVINIDWVPFYVWSENRMKATSTVHRFSYPTKKLVKEYRDTYLPYINRTIDWEQPKLVLNESIQMLLIAGDRRGLFNAIPHINMPKSLPANAKIPTFQIRMKIVEPYLALMICDFHYAVLMAVSGSEPNKDQILTEVTTLNFKGTGSPVGRDLELEKELAEMEREHQLRMGKAKSVDLD